MHILKLLFLLLFHYCAADPYKALGVNSDASTQEIKKAYKDLVKKWHPDKNDSPDAQEMFLKISEAYKLLSDPDRKYRYDATGQTEEPRGFDQGGPNEYKDFFSSFDRGFNKFTFPTDTYEFYSRRSITYRAYMNTVIAKSKHKPYLLLFFSKVCFPCVRIQPIWTRLIEELEPFNFAINTVEALKEKPLTKKLGVPSVPYLIMVLDGHPYHYTDHTISIVSTLDFIKSKFPRKLVQKIDEHKIDSFLSGWLDNKVRVLLFGRLDIIRLRYLSLAWQFRDRILLGYVQLGKPETDKIRSRYTISSNVDSLLVFHEDPYSPVASVAMKDLPYATMKDIIEANKFLHLPRLSSQSTFDALCPIESTYARRRLCVVLITEDISDHDLSRSAFRHLAMSKADDEKERLRYTYIFKEKQTQFIKTLTSVPGAPSNSDLHIVIIWRIDNKYIRYEWVEDQWLLDEASQNKTKEALKRTLHRMLSTNDPMQYEAEIQELFDEHAQGLFWRIINKLSLTGEYLKDNISSEEVITVSSVIATILFVLLGAYVMNHLAKLEEAKVQSMQGNRQEGATRAPQLKIHELRGETYNGLVRLLKPGCRTLVLICDSETKQKLIKNFHKACWPYRKNKTLMFAFMNIERSSCMEWYKRILILGMTEPRELNINPKNTVGTVLSLNGHRKYYCIYHAKHPEDVRLSNPSTSRASGRAHVRRRNAKLTESGNFMGFSESDSSDETDIETGDPRKDSEASDRPLLNYYSSILFEDQLLEGLSNWLDKLFEGMTIRYHINYWPDWVGK